MSRLFEFSMPVKPDPFKNLKLTGKAKKEFDAALKREVATTKAHFNKSGAWDLDVELMVANIVQDITGVDLLWELMSALINDVGGLEGHYDGKNFVVVNVADKVFYDPYRNKLYVAKNAKDVNHDINIGNL